MPSLSSEWLEARNSPYINRFVQPDTIIPDLSNPQSWNRYSYVTNRPVNFNDPTGHEGGNCYDRGYCEEERDLTDWLIAALIDSAESPEMQKINALNAPPQYDGTNKAKAYGLFDYYVSDGAKYDVKDKILDQVGDPIKLGNNWFEYSTAGNILYGFYGKAAGFSDFELYAGAGKAQWDDYQEDNKRGIGPCDLKYFCDTTDDHAAVGFGIYLYDNYYKKDKELTKTDLLNAFETFNDSNKMAQRDRPKDFHPRYSEYPVNRFYQME